MADAEADLTWHAVRLQDPEIEDGATVEGSVDDLQTRWDVYDVGFAGRYA